MTQKKKADETRKGAKRPAVPPPGGKRGAEPVNGGNGLDARVVSVIARVMNAPAPRLGVEMRFVEDLHADSLRVMELVLELQEEFGIDIPDEALEKIRSVGDAIAYVRVKLGG